MDRVYTQRAGRHVIKRRTSDDSDSHGSGATGSTTRWKTTGKPLTDDAPVRRTCQNYGRCRMAKTRILGPSPCHAALKNAVPLAVKRYRGVNTTMRMSRSSFRQKGQSQ